MKAIASRDTSVHSFAKWAEALDFGVSWRLASRGRGLKQAFTCTKVPADRHRQE
jgi:hypothetical protein